ncbi:uncharacterized protein L201_003706 [Kwoniella dendrophila CBS 6074]|uniref:Uncharacterized protein n=1 Tax=Kwoniella dendrophila CBS 6074 TaxID=1295534 RepID=A0AAX4JVF6_9TREE
MSDFRPLCTPDLESGLDQFTLSQAREIGQELESLPNYTPAYIQRDKGGSTYKHRASPYFPLDVDALVQDCFKKDKTVEFRSRANSSMLLALQGQSKVYATSYWGQAAKDWFNAKDSGEGISEDNIGRFTKYAKYGNATYPDLETAMEAISAMTDLDEWGRPYLTEMGEKAYIIKSLGQVFHTTYDKASKYIDIPASIKSSLISADIQPYADDLWKRMTLHKQNLDRTGSKPPNDEVSQSKDIGKWHIRWAIEQNSSNDSNDNDRPSSPPPQTEPPLHVPGSLEVSLQSRLRRLTSKPQAALSLESRFARLAYNSKSSFSPVSGSHEYLAYGNNGFPTFEQHNARERLLELYRGSNVTKEAQQATAAVLIEADMKSSGARRKDATMIRVLLDDFTEWGYYDNTKRKEVNEKWGIDMSRKEEAKKALESNLREPNRSLKWYPQLSQMGEELYAIRAVRDAASTMSETNKNAQQITSELSQEASDHIPKGAWSACQEMWRNQIQKSTAIGVEQESDRIQTFSTVNWPNMRVSTWDDDYHRLDEPPGKKKSGLSSLFKSSKDSSWTKNPDFKRSTKTSDIATAAGVVYTGGLQ